MRIVFWRLKTFFVGMISVAFSVAIFVWLQCVTLSKFSTVEGERVFYLQSASSQGLRKTELDFSDVGKVRGESVRFSIDHLTSDEKEKLVNRLAKEYGATILFSETVCGRTSYYGYTARWSQTVALYGVRINLHIVISDAECVVGSPIIFDGY